MAQETCLDCYRKHIATAMVFEDEAAIGNDYIDHKWLAVGEMHAAEKEVRWKYPVLAQMTRERRLAYIQYNQPVPTIELIKMATELALAEEQNEKSGEENDSQ